jgi:energy-coupling factor transport system ATP-binding protein
VIAPALDPTRRPLADWPARRIPANVGMAFQDPAHQFIARRVADDVVVGPLRAGMPAPIARRRGDELLERLGLADLRDANPYTLSGGEQRRLALAGTLAARPRALMVDEPTYGQDASTFREIARILGEERDRGTAIAFSTHDPPLIDAVADRVHALA